MQCPGHFEAEGRWLWRPRGSTSLFDVHGEVFTEQDKNGLQAGQHHILLLFLASESLFRNRSVVAPATEA